MPLPITDLFSGEGATRLLVGPTFVNANVGFNNFADAASVVVTASGTLAVNTLTTVLALTGRGAINFLAAWHANATSKTLRCRITFDDEVIFDSTGPATAQINAGWRLIGSVGRGASIPIDPVFGRERFSRRAIFEIASSVAETDGCGLAWNYVMFD